MIMITCRCDFVILIFNWEIWIDIVTRNDITLLIPNG